MQVKLQRSINQPIIPVSCYGELRLMWNLSTSVQIIPEDSVLQGNVNWHQVKVKHVHANIHRSSKLRASPGMRSVPAECLQQ